MSGRVAGVFGRVLLVTFDRVAHRDRDRVRDRDRDENRERSAGLRDKDVGIRSVMRGFLVLALRWLTCRNLPHALLGSWTLAVHTWTATCRLVLGSPDH